MTLNCNTLSDLTTDDWKYDFVWEVWWVCEKWINDIDWYVWKFENKKTWKVRDAKWKYLNNYELLEPWTRDITLFALDNCWNAAESKSVVHCLCILFTISTFWKFLFLACFLTGLAARCDLDTFLYSSVTLDRNRTQSPEKSSTFLQVKIPGTSVLPHLG